MGFDGSWPFGFESHLGLRLFLCPLMVDSYISLYFLYHEQIVLQKVGVLSTFYNSNLQQPDLLQDRCM